MFHLTSEKENTPCNYERQSIDTFHFSDSAGIVFLMYYTKMRGIVTENVHGRDPHTREMYEKGPHLKYLGAM
jgi:hypothetical protein